MPTPTIGITDVHRCRMGDILLQGENPAVRSGLMLAEQMHIRIHRSECLCQPPDIILQNYQPPAPGSSGVSCVYLASLLLFQNVLIRHPSAQAVAFFQDKSNPE